MSTILSIKTQIAENIINFNEKRAELCNLELEILKLKKEIDNLHLEKEKKQAKYEKHVKNGTAKLKLCSFFLQNKCKKGDDCTFSHNIPNSSDAQYLDDDI